MRIIAKVRPMDIKAGVRTKTLYKAMGYKEPPDVRDVVGCLTLSAAGPKDIMFLSALHRAVREGGGYTLKIYDEAGELVCETGPEPLEHK